MGLEHLFDAELRYRTGIGPVVPADGRQGELIGSGDGTVVGPAVRGTIRWSMYAADCAYLRRGEPGYDQIAEHLCRTSPGGVIETDDGARINVDARGYGLRGPDPTRPYLWRLTTALVLTTDDPRYRWLNDTLGLWEGEFDERAGTECAHYRAYVLRESVDDHRRKATRRAADVMRWLTEESDAVDVQPERSRLQIRLVQALAEGQAITSEQVERLATAVGLTPDDARRFLECRTERDSDNKVVGIMGLSLNETPHRFEVDGTRLWTWCAVDTLFLPAVLDRPAKVESRSPLTGERVHLTVWPDRVAEINPPGAVVSFVVAPNNPDLSSVATIWGTFCHHIFFFPTPAEAETWAAGRPDIEILSVEEAYTLGRQLASRLLTPEG
jgi:alkylmercury lyase